MNQDTEGHQAIKIFPYEDRDSRFSTFLALGNQDIAGLICGLQETVDRLQDEVKQLQEDRERDREEIDSLRSQIAEVDKQLAMDTGLFNKHLITTIGRVSTLEAKKAAPTEKTLPHLDKLAGHLGEKRKRGVPALMGFLEAAQILGISKRRALQLQPTIQADRRFVIHTRGKTLYIQLR